jgi:hypothetical protein
MLTNWWRKMLKRGWTVDFLLWILAVVLVISGIMAVTRKQYLQGAILIIVGLLVGPGGTSIFQ